MLQEFVLVKSEYARAHDYMGQYASPAVVTKETCDELVVDFGSRYP